MFKKVISLALAGMLAVSATAITASAAESVEETTEYLGAPGGYGKLEVWNERGEYENLMLAMPYCWTNDLTAKNPKSANAAGVYWWAGFDTPDDVSPDKHGWPGYLATQVEEEGVTNLWQAYVPAYGNGESGNGNVIIWNNYLDGGTIGQTHPELDPFWDASCQSFDFPSQYYSRNDTMGDLSEKYEKLFRYIYRTQADLGGLDGAADLDLESDTFWEDINKLAVADAGKDWDSLSSKEQKFAIDEFIDDIGQDDLDFSEFGDYEFNFYNEDQVDEIFEDESSNGDCLSFYFDNMVFVVDLDPNNITLSPTSHKPSFAGDVYFYYGNGDYGTWPTKELNEEMGGISGNFTTGDYATKTLDEIMAEMPEQPADADGNNGGNGGNGNTQTTTVPAAGEDATSSTSDSAKGSNSGNNANGAIATGEASIVLFSVIVLIAGVGAVYFTRKRRQG